MLQQFYKEKAQKERITPKSIFNVELIPLSNKFKELDSKMSIQKKHAYIVYYDFTENDVPDIHDEAIKEMEQVIYERNDYVWTAKGLDTVKRSLSELQNGIDYELHITHEEIETPAPATTFDELNKV